MQYVAVSLLVSAFNPMAAFVMTLMVNARHLFYGLSMLDRFKSTGKLKPYLIFGLTDETFSVLCGPEAERDVSVSYTHLDVYKRQGHAPGSRSDTGFRTRRTGSTTFR